MAEIYSKPQLTEDKMYLIDKLVRKRVKQGRFGIDHSEVLKIELELANKGRDDHMNQLVYKEVDPNEELSKLGLALPKKLTGLETSSILQ